MTRATSAGAREELAVHRRLMRFGEAESSPRRCGRSATRASARSTATSPRSGTPWLDDGGDPIVTEKGLPHARASVLNLIVTVLDEAAADRVVGTMLGLGVRHPSRAIVLVPTIGRGAADDARISTHCHDAPAAASRSATRRSC